MSDESPTRPDRYRHPSLNPDPPPPPVEVPKVEREPIPPATTRYWQRVWATISLVVVGLLAGELIHWTFIHLQWVP